MPIAAIAVASRMIYKTTTAGEETVEEKPVLFPTKSLNTFDAQACIQALKKHFE
jgi:hypothetical protein